MKKFLDVLMPGEVREIVDDWGLLSLVDCSLTMLDVSLLFAFVEKWHKETSLFHLPFGEMTITLDVISSLFHFPMPCSFFTAQLTS